MADNTKIEWTDATVNAVNGCSVVSPGCTNCYAMRLAGTRLKHHPSRAGLTIDTKAGPVWTGEIRVSEKAMLEPLRWRRPRMLFWNAHGDLFHPNVPDAVIDRCFAVMALTPQHIHQVLTKRSDRMRDYLIKRKSAAPVSVAVGDGTMTDHPFNNELLPPPNVWLGVSAEDQTRADERIPHLLATPAAVRFVSAEPLLGPVRLWHHIIAARAAIRLIRRRDGRSSRTHWVIVGGESGPGARPMHPDWARLPTRPVRGAGAAFLQAVGRVGHRGPVAGGYRAAG
jgi:protein gp37